VDASISPRLRVRPVKHPDNAGIGDGQLPGSLMPVYLIISLFMYTFPALLKPDVDVTPIASVSVFSRMAVNVVDTPP
jgi:hypothetical protein